ncbi:hypothetical protein UP09_03300 [Bradyrhizobium sp. LTSP885]|uniref:hypothetical protein n=1 Tax=Bradyrhizobium sp. LTSP885 TaxID=1619232 RepID=UPI0005CB523E|nr:hypothetical protein [Bradyrhizobium sp. LTSP885]KJC51085.1 hypothetical protein UP09_03300 [Bradyrhizobium sp. LTSP885]
MLSVIGESGVSATVTTHPSVQTASRILDTEDTDLQQIGWWFNREFTLTLVPNSEGRVAVPASALDVHISDVDNLSDPKEKARYVRRGNFIYDTYLHSDVLNKSVAVDIITRVAIEDMPSVASGFLRHKAREAIYNDDDGDTFKSGRLQSEVMMAWERLRAKELTMLGTNALDNPTARKLLSGIRGAGYSRNPNLIGGLIR